MCNEIFIDRSKRTNFVAKWEMSISKKVKLTVSHTERQSLVFVVIVCLKVYLVQYIRFGKSGRCSELA